MGAMRTCPHQWWCMAATTASSSASTSGRLAHAEQLPLVIRTGSCHHSQWPKEGFRNLTISIHYCAFEEIIAADLMAHASAIAAVVLLRSCRAHGLLDQVWDQVVGIELFTELSFCGR